MHESIYALCGSCGWIGLQAELEQDGSHPCGRDQCPSCKINGCICCCLTFEEAETGVFE